MISVISLHESNNRHMKISEENFRKYVDIQDEDISVLENGKLQAHC